MNNFEFSCALIYSGWHNLDAHITLSVSKEILLANFLMFFLRFLESGEFWGSHL